MDKIAQSANSARSLRGVTFERNLETRLSEMLEKKKIKSFKKQPTIFDGEFNPDFIVETNKGKIISIDSTTTARTDRLRGKQWDAYGTKLYYSEKYKKEIIAMVVIQDTDTCDREKSNFRRCKVRATLPHSAVDGVVSVEELITLLEK